MVSHELDVIVTRGNAVESCHRVHAAVVDACDRLMGKAGDPGLNTYWRSCAKPFQVMPLLESGGFDAYGWGEEQLALACASHGGEPEHVAIAEAMLSTLGLEEGDLACGPHEPLTARGAKIVRECGARIKRTHNNCSGKHTAMLAFALHKGWPIEGYERIDHPVQQAMLNQVALWSGLRVSEIETRCGRVRCRGLRPAPRQNGAGIRAVRRGCQSRRRDTFANRSSDGIPAISHRRYRATRLDHHRGNRRPCSDESRRRGRPLARLFGTRESGSRSRSKTAIRARSIQR